MKQVVKTKIIGNYLHIWVKKPKGVTFHTARKVK